ncbi:CsxC family protein [Bacillus cereus]|uniref:CsxC family protein n=1 Tax=Bacillus cereus TaxID=1396 RepID=UPI0015963ED3
MMNKPWIGNKPIPIDKKFLKHKIITKLKVEESVPSGSGIEENPFSESEVEESQPSGIEVGNSRTTSIVTSPVVLAERTIQIIVEANISLDPMAIEINNVLKRVFLTHCKLVPIAFTSVPSTNYRRVIKAKLFVEGYIQKNIEYVADQCNGAVYNRIINIPFSEAFDLSSSDFITQPLLVVSSNTTSHFINSKGGDLAGVDKTFLGNSVFYNTQPYCELVRANFDEFDFLPCPPNWNESFSALHRIIVLELTLNILQIQQVQV